MASIASPRRLRFALDIGLACLLFWGTHAAYRGSTGHVQNCDSVYSLVVSEKMLTGGTVNLAGSVPANRDLPYQLLRHTNPRQPSDPSALYYGYPLGSSILSLPFVQNAGLKRGLSMFHPDGRANLAIEDLLQMRIAATVSAAIVVLFYAMCRSFCSPLVSLLIAAGFAFGSPVWSTLSRSLWSHTWMVALLSFALALLLARRRIERPTWRIDLAFGLALGTALFWMLFTRAHGIFSAAAIGLYLTIHHRRLLLATVGTGSLWTLGFVAASLHLFGTVTPPSVYNPDTIDGREVLNRFAWLMVSPSRGLLVYCPYLVVVAGMLMVFRKQLDVVDRHEGNRTLHLSSSFVGERSDRSCGCNFDPGEGALGTTSEPPHPVCRCIRIDKPASPPQSWGRGEKSLLLPAGIAIATHTLLFSCYDGWHMGSSYGPRYFCDLLPWFVLATAIAVRSVLNATGQSRRTAFAIALLVACFGWGVFVHSRGANSMRAWLWNWRAIAVGHEAAVKDWRHPQFLSGVAFEVKPDGSIVEKP